MLNVPERKMEEVACPVCRGERRSIRFDKGEQLVVTCLECGVYYVTPRLTPEAARAMYDAPEYFAGGTDVGYTFNYLTEETEKFVHAYYGERLDFMARFRPPGRLLDVGCATGYFVSLAADRGWDAYGLEPSRFAARLAQERLGNRVRHGELLPGTYPPCCFDAVTLWDVLEHVTDPRGLLATTHEILSDGGIVALSVPSMESPNAELAGGEYWQIKPLEHITYFPRSILERLLNETGFRPVFMTSSLLGPPLGETGASKILEKPKPGQPNLLQATRLLDIGDNLEAYALRGRR